MFCLQAILGQLRQRTARGRVFIEKIQSDLELKSHSLAPSRSGSFSSAVSMTCCCKTNDTSLEKHPWIKTQNAKNEYSDFDLSSTDSEVAHLASSFLSNPCSLEASCRSPCAKRPSPGSNGAVNLPRWLRRNCAL